MDILGHLHIINTGIVRDLSSILVFTISFPWSMEGTKINALWANDIKNLLHLNQKKLLYYQWTWIVFLQVDLCNYSLNQLPDGQHFIIILLCYEMDNHVDNLFSCRSGNLSLNLDLYLIHSHVFQFHHWLDFYSVFICNLATCFYRHRPLLSRLFKIKVNPF